MGYFTAMTSWKYVYLTGVLGLMSQCLLDVAVASRRGFFFEYIGNNVTILRLRCHAGSSSPANNVLNMNIYNATSRNDVTKMAWISRGRQAELLITDRRGVFVSGIMANENYDPDRLEILIFDYESHQDQRFGCNVTKSNKGQIREYSWNILVNKSVPKTVSTTTPHPIFTDGPSRVQAVKNKEAEGDSLPMTVLIVMLVLISILLFLAVFLLLHRYRSRCQRRDEDLYHPPAYCMAPDHHHHLPHLASHLQDWPDNSTAALIKSPKSVSGSARILAPRSHYSIAAQHQQHHLHAVMPPLPPLPPPTPNGGSGSGGGDRRCRSEERGAEGFRRPPSTNSSVKVPYIQPQDAIGQESSEDGEVAAFSSATPRVRYKSTRESPSRQNSPLYACVPVSSTDE